MDVNSEISKRLQGWIPSVCTESPAPGKQIVGLEMFPKCVCFS